MGSSKSWRSKHLEKDPYNLKQNILYKECLYGLKYSKPEDIFERQQIIKRYNKTQKVLNSYKQTKIIEITNDVLCHLFPNSIFIKELAEKNRVHQDFMCILTFKDLGISKDCIIKLLIDNKILPKNFYEIK